MYPRAAILKLGSICSSICLSQEVSELTTNLRNREILLIELLLIYIYLFKLNILAVTQRHFHRNNVF